MNRLIPYIGAMLRNRDVKLLAGNGHRDHIHLFFSAKPSASIPELVRVIKSESSGWLKAEFQGIPHFAWQRGYAIFTVGMSQTGQLKKYIENQFDHHRHRTFEEEYKSFLEKYEIEYEEEFVFG